MHGIEFNSSDVDRTSTLNRCRRTGLAGGLSFLLHTFLLLLGGFCLRASLPKMTAEPERTAGVVLVMTNENRETSYYQDTNSADAESTATHEVASTQGPTVAALPAAESLPPTSTTAKLPGNNSALDVAKVDSVSEGIVGGTGTRPVIDPFGDVAAVMEAEAKRVKKVGPIGPQASLSLFGTPAARGHSFIFLIDRSHSMGTEGLNALAAAESELLAAIKNLEANHSFQIIAYNEAPKYMRDRKLLPATPESLAMARDFLQTLVAHGPTDHTLALTSALRLQPDVLFIFTDGDDPYIGMRQRERLRTIAGATQIHCVQFGWKKPIDDTSRECLQALARENHGSYTFVDMGERK